MRIAVIGDLHHFRMKLHPRRLVGRRAVGQANLWLNRRFAFHHGMLQPLLNRIPQIKPDMILLTGDVTTTSLEDEFRDVVEFLKPLSDQFDVRLVPGNHDRYTRGAVTDRRVEQIMSHLLPKQFPHFEPMFGKWHLLSLDCAKPSILAAQGRIGADQLRRVEAHLSTLTDEDGILLLCHYPVTWPKPPAAPPIPWNTRLSDGRHLRRLIEQCRARIVYIHGHIHRPWFWEANAGPMKAVTNVNAGAPCLPHPKYPDGQGFWEIELDENPCRPIVFHHHIPRLTPLNGEKKRLRRQRACSDDVCWEVREHRSTICDAASSAHLQADIDASPPPYDRL